MQRRPTPTATATPDGWPSDRRAPPSLKRALSRDDDSNTPTSTSVKRPKTKIYDYSNIDFGDEGSTAFDEAQTPSQTKGHVPQYQQANRFDTPHEHQLDLELEDLQLFPPDHIAKLDFDANQNAGSDLPTAPNEPLAGAANGQSRDWLQFLERNDSFTAPDMAEQMSALSRRVEQLDRDLNTLRNGLRTGPELELPVASKNMLYDVSLNTLKPHRAKLMAAGFSVDYTLAIQDDMYDRLEKAVTKMIRDGLIEKESQRQG